ncbi:HD domain-containing protein [uncultured Winogradskyella sp.]|uniref:HD domain-containing protein n=2 Tax=uncultured Winogradskyella sp. TaxID=395353 RepID=UPI00262300DD|nr:HD domain-containing protein [uncultured Winogradskyella sp.]|tara:strand:+ start:5227 stop:5889 length:663 start_codon:yes stop_codon:yes gene_type:complete
MTISEAQLIESTINFVKTELKNAEGGHDWFHIERVYKNTLSIAKHEDVNTTVVTLAALLHDIADSKFHNGDETIGSRKASEFLLSKNVDSEIIEHVTQIIDNMSFKNTFDLNTSFTSKEMEVVQDADRLDAIGAIGIARCFNYGGFKDRALYNPDIKPNLNMTKAEYKNSDAPTINHFYEKLLLLKDQMNTKTGKRMALERHNYMKGFLKQFYAEWEGKL